MEDFTRLLEESVKAHGHLCAGQVIGVRMAMLGCRLVGIDSPKDPAFRKKLIVFVEIDRCATDAIASVTGCQLGKRTLKFKNYGINAATFFNIETETAYRIVSTEKSRELAASYVPGEVSAKFQQIEGYKRMPDELLFDVQQVSLHLEETDLPGPPRRHVTCERCGQVVRDGRETLSDDNRIICRPCSSESYFSPVPLPAHTPVSNYTYTEVRS